jgi:Ca2+/Na+ antiporter
MDESTVKKSPRFIPIALVVVDVVVVLLVNVTMLFLFLLVLVLVLVLAVVVVVVVYRLSQGHQEYAEEMSQPFDDPDCSFFFGESSSLLIV